MDSIPEKEMQKHKKKAEELFQTIKKKTSKILNITDIMADGNGELRLILHTDKKEGTRTQQQKIAEELIKTYPELFSFQRGDIQTSCNISMGNGTMICETEIFQAEDDDKKSLLYQVKEGATLTNAGDGVYYLSFPYDKNLEQLQDFTIMSRKEAEQVMRQGGFYSTLEPSEFLLVNLNFYMWSCPMAEERKDMSLICHMLYRCIAFIHGMQEHQRRFYWKYRPYIHRIYVR